MRDIIRRKLREESQSEDKKVKNLKKLVEKEGLESAADMLNVTITFLVRTTGCEITHDTARLIILENVYYKKIPTKYKEFTISCANETPLLWISNEKVYPDKGSLREAIQIMATPFFYGDSWTPVELEHYFLHDDTFTYHDIEGQGDYFETVKPKGNFNTEFKTVEDVFEWYKNEYCPTVYEYIQEKLIPQLHRHVRKSNRNPLN